MHFNRGIAVFQCVFLGQGLIRKFALFSYGHKPQVELVSQHRAQNKTSGINAGHQIQPLAHITIDKQIDEYAEYLWILENRRDISENNPWLWPVGYATYGVANVGSR